MPLTTTTSATAAPRATTDPYHIYEPLGTWWIRAEDGKNCSNDPQPEECDGMRGRLAFAFFSMWTTGTVLLLFCWVFVFAFAMSCAASTLGAWGCNSLRKCLEAINAVVQAVLQMIITVIPIAALGVFASAITTVNISLTRMCRRAPGPIFTRPLVKRRDFEFGWGTKLSVFIALVTGVVFLACLISVVFLRRRVKRLTQLLNEQAGAGLADGAAGSDAYSAMHGGDGGGGVLIGRVVAGDEGKSQAGFDNGGASRAVVLQNTDAHVAVSLDGKGDLVPSRR